MIKGKSITGFDWFEETPPEEKMKYLLTQEAALKERDVHYKKHLFQ